MLYTLYKLCRDAANDGIRFYIFGHYGSCPDNGIFANGNTGKYRCTCSYPAVALQHNRFAGQYLMLFRVVVVGNELGVSCHQHIVLDGDAACTHKERIIHHHHILAYLHVLSAHNRRGSHQTASLAKLAEDFVNQFVVL